MRQVDEPFRMKYLDIQSDGCWLSGRGMEMRMRMRGLMDIEWGL